MKHSDFYSKINEIRKQECQELFAAVQAHNGCYEWKESEEHPIIAVTPDNTIPNPIDVNVTKVWIENGILHLCGEEKNDGYEIEFKPDEVFAGHLSFIIDYIPETAEMSDTSGSLPKLIARCPQCGSLNVQIKAWVKPNKDNECIEPISEEEDDCWCDECQEHVELEYVPEGTPFEKPEKLPSFKTGDKVFWKDPEGISSGEYEIFDDNEEQNSEYEPEDLEDYDCRTFWISNGVSEAEVYGAELYPITDKN